MVLKKCSEITFGDLVSVILGLVSAVHSATITSRAVVAIGHAIRSHYYSYFNLILLETLVSYHVEMSRAQSHVRHMNQ